MTEVTYGSGDEFARQQALTARRSGVVFRVEELVHEHGQLIQAFMGLDLERLRATFAHQAESFYRGVDFELLSPHLGELLIASDRDLLLVRGWHGGECVGVVIGRLRGETELAVEWRFRDDANPGVEPQSLAALQANVSAVVRIMADFLGQPVTV